MSRRKKQRRVDESPRGYHPIRGLIGPIWKGKEMRKRERRKLVKGIPF